MGRPRAIVATTYYGPKLVRELGNTLAQQQRIVDQMSDAEISKSLAKLTPKISPLPATASARKERLRSWPSQADLDQMALDIGPIGGVMPICRLLDAPVRWPAEPAPAP